MRHLLLLATLFFPLTVITTSCSAPKQTSPTNVWLIPIDDLNDWIGCLDGHPQAKTPNIDRLAKRGVLFTNAHCQSPVCNPSRGSMMSSLYPATTGIYFLNPSIKSSPRAKKTILMPDRFVNEGYYATGAGKIYHGGQNARYMPNYGGSFGGFGTTPKKKLTTFPGHPLWDWGVYPPLDEQTPDFKIAAWTINELQKVHDTPLFLASGFMRPHVPQFAPQKWFDMFPIEDVQLPKIIQDDLKDESKYGHALTCLNQVSPDHQWVLENNAWKPLVQSYLACVAFVDAQVGKVLDAYDNSDIKDNTFIVLYSDHGFHLGEKERWAKRSLWENGTRVPMIIVGPGIKANKKCSKPVQLLDIYPTLLELTGLAANDKHQGNSLVPLLKNTKAPWPHFARTSFGPGNVAIRSEHYRYVHYNDGTEAFYDHNNDPHEWYNLINQKKMASQIEQHKQKLPTQYHAVLGKNATGHKSFNGAESLINKN